MELNGKIGKFSCPTEYYASHYFFFCRNYFCNFICIMTILFQCLLDMPRDAPKLFRKPEQCDICESFTQVDKITNVSPNFLLENYINRFKPVVVSDGALNWPAKSLFTFDFFKSLFETVELRSGKDKNCQFFPYETEFTSVKEVFNMSADRIRGNSGEKPWYVGWNNCNDEAGRYLKQFYDRPYFLSNMSEQMSLSWVFMGTPGYGAHMHVSILYRKIIYEFKQNCCVA